MNYKAEYRLSIIHLLLPKFETQVHRSCLLQVQEIALASVPDQMDHQLKPYREL